MSINEETLQQYLDKAGYSRSAMKLYVARHGTVNNVDYYIEAMKTYFNDDLNLNGELQVQGVDDEGHINL